MESLKEEISMDGSGPRWGMAQEGSGGWVLRVMRGAGPPPGNAADGMVGEAEPTVGWEADAV